MEAGRESFKTQAPLASVLDQSVKVQDKVEAAGLDLGVVNEVLQREVATSEVPGEVVGALEQASEVEAKVQEAAAELVVVDEALAEEIDARLAMEEELEVSQAALAESVEEAKLLRHDALHDELTGLPNATLFKDRLEHAIVQARRHSWKAAVMFIDLDRFKQINDTHGHDVGDSVLLLVAQRLEGFVRQGDTVSRRSGDEFLYLMLEVSDEATARTMAQHIVTVISAPAELHGIALSVQASVGLALFPDHGDTVEALLKQADVSMYGAKGQASGSV